jgi:UDP-N-acetyl-D-mannosaminuronate dehydrogenase
LICRAFQAGAVENLKGKRIAALGLSYKPDVDDLRESPAVEVAHLLTAAGASVQAYEPFKVDAQLPGLTIAPTLERAVADADLLVLLVMHTPLKEIDPLEMAKLTPARMVVDTVDGWPSRPWLAAGFQVIRQGDGKNNPELDNSILSTTQ